MPNIIISPMTTIKNLNGNEKYVYVSTISNTGLGYFNFPNTPNTTSAIAMIYSKIIPIASALDTSDKGVHRNDIYLGPYKFFPVKEPLEFTPGFTERQNYVEVL